jgi:hypothetical protein
VEGESLTDEEGDGEEEGLLEGLSDGEEDGLGLEDGEDDGDVDGLVDGLVDGDVDGLLDGLVDGDVDGLLDGLVDGDVLGDVDGELLGEVAGAKKVIQAIAPSSALVPPVHVLVAVPAVVELAVVKRKLPASTSKSSVALAQVLATVSAAPAAIAKKPPLVAIVCEPVVNGSVASMSVEPSPPVVGEVSPAPVTE